MTKEGERERTGEREGEQKDRLNDNRSLISYNNITCSKF
jgi:hypothetical protein